MEFSSTVGFRFRRQAGFSLIELTIVVLVILILLGLAIPRISSLRDSAKQAECVSNIRNIEMAIARWEQKEDKTFQQGWINKKGRGQNGKKSHDLSPYVKDVSTFDCPVYDRGAGEFYYVTPLNDQTKKYKDYFPGVNCYGSGRPNSLALDYPHTTYTEDPFK